MIRQALRLLVEAAEVELDRWVHPTQEPVAVTPEPAPAAKPASKWTSPAYHVEVLDGTVCPYCGAAKSVGWYMCRGCVVKTRAA
jgi:hypothetical protein